MSIKFKSILCIASALIYSSAIQASPKMDANGDDEISRIEYMSFKSNAFNKQDKNFDGRLTKQEIREARKERNRQNIKKRFKNIDKNGDGHITQDEHDNATRNKNEKLYENSFNKVEEWFNKMDADKNDHISRLEYKAFLENQRAEQLEKTLKTTQRAFARLDLDRDGRVTEFEYVDKGRKPGSKTAKKNDPLEGLYAHETAKPKKRTRRDGNSDGDITKREDRDYNEYYFDKLDKNKDGVITKKEGGFLFKSYGMNGDIIIDHQRLAR